MGNYRDLRVWHSSYSLALKICRATASFPSSERYGLTSQLRRAAMSVAINIAEGGGRSNDGDFRRFVQIARGSLQEVICELEFSRDLEILAASAAGPLLDDANEVGRMLNGLLKVTREKGRRPTGHPPQPS
jgi:four helix bundle protein